MLTGKQRATLRKMANHLPALYQIGKDGVTENILKQFDDALEAKELIKVHILDNSLLEIRETADDIAAQLGADTVQTIGSKFVLYRKSQENPQIEL